MTLYLCLALFMLHFLAKQQLRMIKIKLQGKGTACKPKQYNIICIHTLASYF